MLSRVFDIISNLPGVLAVEEVAKKHISAIEDSEEANLKIQMVPFANIGIKTILKREFLLVFLKDTSFRRPPCPTVYLVEEYDTDNHESDHLIEIEGARYYVVGEEVLNPDIQYKEKHAFFGSGFVLFPDRRKGPKKPAYFMIPPIAFPELQDRKEELGITEVMSVSPSTITDDLIRQAFGFSTDPELATIMVGFDRV
jgi:hypothetical protein